MWVEVVFISVEVAGLLQTTLQDCIYIVFNLQLLIIPQLYTDYLCSTSNVASKNWWLISDGFTVGVSQEMEQITYLIKYMRVNHL